jgi:hypothetical protein
MVSIREVAKASGFSDQTIRRMVLYLLDRMNLSFDEYLAIYLNTESVKIKAKALEKMIKIIEKELDKMPSDEREKFEKLLERMRVEHGILTTYYKR